jgi:hypothetical protein
LFCCCSPDNSACLTAEQLCFNGAKDAEESDVDCEFVLFFQFDFESNSSDSWCLLLTWGNAAAAQDECSDD